MQKPKQGIAFLALVPGVYVLAYLFFTEGGMAGVGKWFFSTGIVGLFMLALGVRVVVRAYKSNN